MKNNKKWLDYILGGMKNENENCRSKEYPMRKVSIKRTGAPYFEGVIR